MKVSYQCGTELFIYLFTNNNIEIQNLLSYFTWILRCHKFFMQTFGVYIRCVTKCKLMIFKKKQQVRTVLFEQEYWRVHKIFEKLVKISFTKELLKLTAKAWRLLLKMEDVKKQTFFKMAKIIYIIYKLYKRQYWLWQNFHFHQMNSSLKYKFVFF